MPNPAATSLPLVAGQSRFVNALHHQLHYLEWGTPRTKSDANDTNNTVVMIHGLTRTCSDFIPLASYLSAEKGYHCLSFDVIGRGLSTWAPLAAAGGSAAGGSAGGEEAAVTTTADPSDTEYAIPFYVTLFAEAFKVLGLANIALVGTSMGGIIGFVGMGTGAFKPYVRKLVMNDIGPYVPMEALRAISRYTRTRPYFSTTEELLADLRQRMGTFGVFTDDQFLSFAVPYIRRRESDGWFTFHYDERILNGIRKLMSGEGAKSLMGVDAGGRKAADENAVANTSEEEDAKAAVAEETARMRAAAEPLWGLFKATVSAVPLLLVRGANSELLLKEDADRMVAMGQPSEGGKGARLHLVPNSGHAPMLTMEEDMVAIAEFLQTA